MPTSSRTTSCRDRISTSQRAHPAGVEQFYSLYFIMTGLHALHMIIGIGLMAVIAIMAWRKHFDSTYYTPVEVSGLLALRRHRLDFPVPAAVSDRAPLSR